MNKKNNLMLVGLFSLLLFSLIPTSAYFSFYRTVPNFSVDIYIWDAYYADLDLDGYEDDIFIEIDLTLTNQYVYTDVEVFIGVTLPSGMEHWFKFDYTFKKTTLTGYITLGYDLYNTATELGWYEANAVGFAQGEEFSYMDTLIFDPPGTGGGDPSARDYVL
ncbi:MAG: hypothetical protein INQ03_22780 [Candidatus Heimdallarchaeota archaeon]|nr:hypothetical protein [Candidatus Heimdallarchaeota archaeon]